MPDLPPRSSASRPAQPRLSMVERNAMPTARPEATLPMANVCETCTATAGIAMATER